MGAERGSAAALTGGQWTQLPTAPISPRSNAAAVWTGAEMLVWGPADGNATTLTAEGAAYDPAGRTWRMLPPAPLSSRIAAATVWTGTCWWIWGGQQTPTSAGLPDGAVYSPGTGP